MTLLKAPLCVNAIFVISLFKPDHIFESYGAGTGPIYLSELNCHGSEATLLDCGTFADATGIHDCNHKEDIGVHCQGNVFCKCMNHRLCTIVTVYFEAYYTFVLKQKLSYLLGI